MEDKFKAFPKIRQFSDVVRHVRNRHDFKGIDDDCAAVFRHDSPYPVISYSGTVKLHGTCSAVRIVNGRRTPESRSRDISIARDNAGFAAFVAGVPEKVWNLLPSDCVLFGEWCGDGIQKGVAINQLPKMWVLFDKFVDGNHEELDLPYQDSLKMLNDAGIYFIRQFRTYFINIDFEQPELAQNKLREITLEVETECPVGTAFDVKGVGEGVVWRPVDKELTKDSGYWMKVKGSLHSSSKVKTIAAVDVEKMASVAEFVEATVTQNRLEQGLDVLREAGKAVERKETGFYMKWIVDDILNEEVTMLVSSGLCAKDVGKSISNKARVFWFSQCDKF